MADHNVTNRDVRDLAVRTDVRAATSLVLGSQQDGKAHLRETTPRVLHNVAIDQDALRVFQFEEIFDNKWIPVCSTHVSGLPFHPGQRLEHVILSDLNISGCGSCRASAK